MEKTLGKVLVAVLLILAALLSFLVAAEWAMKPETHEGDIASIDDKVDTVLKLTAASTVASAGLSAMPGDMTTPIAEKLADFTEYFLLILCVLYSEKYLLTLLGIGAFRILIPVACLMGVVAQFFQPAVLKRLGIKLAVLGLAFYFVIPLSLKASDMIYEIYSASIDTTIASAEELSQETEQLAEAAKDKSAISMVLERLTETAEGLTKRAASLLNRFVETLAVMIVTSCVIPLLVLLFFLWTIRQVTGLDLHGLRPRRLGRRISEEFAE